MTPNIGSNEDCGSQMDCPQAGPALRGRRIAVLGMGYVGVPTAMSFTDYGAEVLGIDTSESRLSAIEDRRIDLLARDLPRLTNALDQQLLRLTTDSSVIADADFIVICVPTPVDDHLTPDLTPLSTACGVVVEHARHGQTIVLTSTTYAGCTDDLLIDPLQKRGFRIGEDLFVAFSAERIDPGVVDHAPELTPRVIGGSTPACSEHAAEILMFTASSLHLVSSPRTAEMTKLLENTFRAVNVALANEFASAASELDIDIMEVIKAASTKPYGYMPFFPGPGVGGHCIPCDPHYLLWQLRALRITAPVTEAAMAANVARPRTVVETARRVLSDQGKSCRGAKALVLGVSYKPGVGDTRESPAIVIIETLLSDGADVSFSDPYVETIRTSSGKPLLHVPEPWREHWDIVIVHTAHPNVDHDWLSDQQAVVDATYRLNLPGLQVP